MFLPTVVFGEFVGNRIELVAKSRASKKMAGAMLCGGTTDIGLTFVSSACKRVTHKTSKQDRIPFVLAYNARFIEPIPNAFYFRIARQRSQ